ncbi:MAG TPA: ribonuclease HII, partial [candidate division Zixibacteria bacterium]|nr:ribonuclease HII [candidate division Zixibacteria bacterium]
DRMERLYPQFRFSQHKGYCTPAHLEELRAHGPCEIHRKSFGPVAELLQYALV